MAFSEIRRRAPNLEADFARGMHPVLRRVYAARGIARTEDLDLSLERLLPVSSLDGIEGAVHVLMQHRQGRVLVVGDFDADGATSSALVVRALRSLDFAHVDFLVPDRFRFGYGLTPEIVARAATRRPTLLVTVDNGISSIDGVDAANAAGIPVLVTDHHLPGVTLPRAAAIVNPNLTGASFMSTALAGVGVAFYVVAAVARELPHASFRAADLLDLVALGTVADVVPLDRNNRILVAQGLRRIRAGRCVPGIRALLEAAGRSCERMTAADLGFAVAPRLNAAGRLTDMSIGIACLLADAPADAARLAAQLGKLNEERRAIEQRMQIEAVEIATALQLGVCGSAPLGLCLFDERWHQGVVGLVAGRIKDRLHRPVIAFARADGGSLRGSARSISGLNIRDALDSIAARHPGLLGKFGGHAMAAGMTLAEKDLERFRLAFAAEIECRVDPDSLRGVVHSDGELTGDDFCVATARVLRGGGPWGQGFPEPTFDGAFNILDSRVVGGRHLKMKLEPLSHCAADTDAARGAGGLDAIAFGYADDADLNASMTPGRRLEVAYRLEVNEYRGAESLQLNCQHIKPV